MSPKTVSLVAAIAILIWLIYLMADYL